MVVLRICQDIIRRRRIHSLGNDIAGGISVDPLGRFGRSDPRGNNPTNSSVRSRSKPRFRRVSLGLAIFDLTTVSAVRNLLCKETWSPMTIRELRSPTRADPKLTKHQLIQMMRKFSISDLENETNTQKLDSPERKDVKW